MGPRFLSKCAQEEHFFQFVAPWTTVDQHLASFMIAWLRAYARGKLKVNVAFTIRCRDFYQSVHRGGTLLSMSHHYRNHCSGGRRDLYHGSYQLVMGRVSLLIFKMIFEKFKMLESTQEGTQSQ